MTSPPKKPPGIDDPHAFDLLYKELAPRVLGFALRLTDGARTEAEDLTQETFLAAFARPNSFKGRSGLLAWLLGIAKRRYRDANRTPRPSTLPLSPEMGEIVVGTPGPEEAVTRSVILEAALARLPAAQREALLLVTQQGLTYKEAAAVLETPVGTLKWRVHEAASAMRTLLIEMEDAQETANKSTQQLKVPAQKEIVDHLKAKKEEEKEEKEENDASVETASPDVRSLTALSDTSSAHLACRR